MKRRDFLRTAGAAATLPVLPMPVRAAPAAMAPISAAKVDWAALYARANAHATPELIQTWLRVGPEQAHAILSDLVRRKIVHAPVAGTAAAVDPMYRSAGFPQPRAITTKISDHLKKMTEAELEADEDAVDLDVEATGSPDVDAEDDTEVTHETS